MVWVVIYVGSHLRTSSEWSFVSRNQCIEFLKDHKWDDLFVKEVTVDLCSVAAEAIDKAISYLLFVLYFTLFQADVFKRPTLSIGGL